MNDQQINDATSVLSEVARIKSLSEQVVDNSVSDIDVSLENSKLRINTRSNGRMQFRFNLDKDEATGLKNFMNMVKPPEVSEEQFLKTCCLRGIASMQEELAGLIQKYAEANPEELEELGVEVDTNEDGSLEITETTTTETE